LYISSVIPICDTSAEALKISGKLDEGEWRKEVA
jgi:hypothetical protein